ncbi:hypothetical protein SAMN04488101_1221, partial [Pedobacter nyackensis]
MPGFVSLHRSIYCLFLLFCLLINLPGAFADGSRDLYPVGAQGNRAFLYSSTGSPSAYFPFKTSGTHYVYANVGEYINLASSSQGKGNSRIRYTSPSGVQNTTTLGVIASRTEELAGPRFPTQGAGGNRYKPFSFQVGAGDGGVWKIEFIPPGTSEPDAEDILAKSSWSQSNSVALISAWDISVCDAAGSNWIYGRVYTNVFNLRLSKDLNNSSKAYHGVNYVLTQDGRAYRVKNNGNNGYAFTFFSNNRGFIDAAGNPTYKSLNTTTIADKVKDPRTQDDTLRNLVTHKLFYRPPAADLPETAPVAVDGVTPSKTWLKKEAIVPNITGIGFTGSEGTVGQASQKGGIISFTANVAGTYKITLPLGSGKDRVLNGPAAAGVNSIVWDGRDAFNNVVPGGLIVPEVKVSLASAEVHFPFIDMEINPNGIVIELTENTTLYKVDSTSTDESVYSDRVYWDDSDISGGLSTEISNPKVNNVDGISSRTNGHIWGTYSDDSMSGNSGTGQYSFGNERAMDTYAYILSKEEAKPLNVTIKVADLEVVSIIPTINIATPNQVSYQIKVRNSGGSDVVGARFDFKILAGVTFNGVSCSFTNPSGAENNIIQTINEYQSNLDLPANCLVTYTIVGTIDPSVLGQDIRVEASIMRPKDVTDPDATNTEFSLAPSNPHDECLNGTLTEGCNNIKYNTLDRQELCVNSSITPIEYILEPGGTEAEIQDPLPSGLTASFVGGKLTITGTPTAPGSFTITLNTKGSIKEKKTFFLFVYPKAATSDIIINDKAICKGETAELTANLADGTLISNGVFNWYSDATLATKLYTGATYSVSPVITTTYFVTVKGDNTCENEAGTAKAVTVTVNPLPDAPEITGTTVICEGDVAVLTSELATSYQWYFNESVIPTATDRTYDAKAAGRYTVIVTNVSGCSSPVSNEIVVTVNPLPVKPGITGTAAICDGDVTILSTVAAITYQWYFNGSVIQDAISQTYKTKVAGRYTVITTNGSGCFSPVSEEFVVTVNPLPTIVSQPLATPVCEGTDAVYSVTSNATDTYQWQYEDGGVWKNFVDGGNISGATNATLKISAIPLTDDGKKIKVVVSSEFGCSIESNEVVVTVNKAADRPFIYGSNIICKGGSIVLTCGSDDEVFQWYFNGSIIADATNSTYHATKAGKYTVTVANALGCYSQQSEDFEVTVVELPLTPTIAYDGLTVCEGSTVKLTSSPAAKYQWYLGGVEIIGATNQEYTATASGNYSVLVTNAGGCSKTSTRVSVVISPLPPTPGVTVTTTTTFCAGGSVILTSDAVTGNQWYLDGNAIAGATGTTYEAKIAGKYTVVVTDGMPCSSLISNEIVVT